MAEAKFQMCWNDWNASSDLMGNMQVQRDSAIWKSVVTKVKMILVAQPSWID
jgi:hypothetical protein